MGKIVCLFKVSTAAVLKWIKSAALKVKSPNIGAESDIVMSDEVWHFVNGKKQNLALESY